MPPSSPTIVGSAVPTMVWSSAASSMPVIRPLMSRRICRWLRRGLASAAVMIPVSAPGLVFGPDLSLTRALRAGTRGPRGGRCVSARLCLSVLALGDLLDHLVAEGREVVRLAAGHQAVVDVHLLVDPVGTGV